MTLEVLLYIFMKENHYILEVTRQNHGVIDFQTSNNGSPELNILRIADAFY
jgi:hypothetical protein